MSNKNKKGFTLIELLAIIALLGIVLAIAIPKVLGIFDNVEKEAFRMSGEQLFQSTIAYADKESFTSTLGRKTFTIENGKFVGDFIPVSGKLPDNGKITIIENGEIKVEISNDKYCAIKELYDEHLTVKDNLTDCNFSDPVIPPDTCFDFSGGVINSYLYWDDETCPLSVEIPTTIGGVTVTTIGSWSFESIPITTLVIPNTVTTIMDRSIMGCDSLKNLYMTDSVTSIGDFALAYGNISDLILSKNIKTLGIGIWADNMLPLDQAFLYGRNSNGTENKTHLVSYGGWKRDIVQIPQGVVTVGDDALEYSMIEEVVIPNGVTSIGEYALGYNNLDSIVIPDSVTSIGDKAFSYNQLKNITFPKGITSLGSMVFLHNSLTSLTIPNTMTNIGPSAFGYNQLTSLTIPSSVTTIESQAFQGNLLTSLTIPSNVKTIGANAFQYNQLTNITIPSTVTSFSTGVFRYNQLTNFSLPNNMTSIPQYTFADNLFASITIPSTVTNIGSNAFQNNQLTSLTIPSNVTTIGASAFQNNQLTSITIPSTVTSLSTGVFRYNQLTNFSLPNNMTSIPQYTFANNLLASITIPSTVTTIGIQAFANNLLTSITIPSTVTSLGNQAFQNNQLTSVTIPANVTMASGTSNAISSTFYTAYVTDNAKAAGTYTAPSQGGTWTKQ